MRCNEAVKEVQLILDPWQVKYRRFTAFGD